MINPASLEVKYQDFMSNLESYVPDGIIPIDLELLRQMKILTQHEEAAGIEHPLTHYFHVIETQEKITLFNDQFVVWIVPQTVDEEAVTFALIGVITGEDISLELCYSASGVYNSSKIVLRVLEQFLEEIYENERVLSRLSEV